MLTFVITGLPISIQVFYKQQEFKKQDLSFLIATSLLFGFGLSALSASIAYSFIGLNSYFYVYFCLSLIFWIYHIVNRKRIELPLYSARSIFPLLVPFAFSIYFCRSQWDSQLRPILTSAPGPDVSQNLMAAQIADKLGGTWSQTSSNLMEKIGVTNLSDAYLRLFELPSFKEFAGFEYMVFGIRWGLTIPMNQIMKLFGSKIVMLEVGIVLMTTLLSLSIIFYASSRLIVKNISLAVLFTLILISNGAFLFQYFYGGISQAFGTIAIAGVLMAIVLFIKNYEKDRVDLNTKGVFLLATFSWIGLIVTYLPAGFVLILAFACFCTVILLIYRTAFKLALQVIVAPIVAAFCLNPILTYIVVFTSENQKANLQTGYNTGIWQSPVQLMGLFHVYPRADGLPSYTVFVLLLSYILTFILLAFFLIATLKRRQNLELFSCLGLILLLLNLVALFISYNGPIKSDYIYNKVNLYYSPFLLFTIFALIIGFKIRKKLVNFVVFGMLISVVVPAINYTEVFYSSSEAIKFPHQYNEIFSDVPVQEYLYSNNFIQPYKLAYNFTGVFGAEYSIGRAPNTSNLNSRLDRELLILCFTGDPDCNPPTPRIFQPNLEAYGISVYESELTTKEFYALPIIEKFYYALESVGSDSREVDPRFVGGNPYLK